MKRIGLKEGLGVKIQDTRCEIHGYGGFCATDLDNQQISLIRRLKGDGLPASDIKNLSLKERAILKLLSEKKLLRIFESDYSRNEIWLSHFHEDAREVLKKVANKSVLIVGCGGTGSIVADHLARAGIKKFFLVDGALLDEPDLNRQFPYSISELGRPKVELLKEHLQALGANSVITHEDFILKSEDLDIFKDEPIDLIIWCADKPVDESELFGLEFADKMNTSIVFGSVGISDEVAGPLLKSADERNQYREQLLKQKNLGLDIRTIQGSICFTNTLVAAKVGMLAYRELLTAE